MQCPYCGKEIASDSQFCEYCGKKVVRAKSLKPLWITLTIILALSTIGLSGLTCYLYDKLDEVKVVTTDPEPGPIQIPDRSRIENIIKCICDNRSKGGNYSALSQYYADVVSPYYKNGTSRRNTEIPRAVRDFNDKQDYYVIEFDDAQGIKLGNMSFPCEVTFYNRVRWSNSRRGEHEVYAEICMWFDSDYKITGYIEKSSQSIK